MAERPNAPAWNRPFSLEKKKARCEKETALFFRKETRFESEIQKGSFERSSKWEGKLPKRKYLRFCNKPTSWCAYALGGSNPSLGVSLFFFKKRKA